MTEFSYQLFFSRNFPPLSDTFKMLSEFGYSGVEAFGGILLNTEDFAKLRAELDANNLKMPTSHIDLKFLQNDPAKAIEIAKTLGIEVYYFPFLQEPDRPTDTAGWKAFANTLSEAGKLISDAGLTFGWHNHDFEFFALEDGGLPMEILLEEAPELGLEFDVAWAVRANYHPIAFIEKYSDRMTAAHVKDIAPEGECEDESGWADVGQGIVDWSTIYPKLKEAGVSHFVMEHDNPSDHRRFAQRSIQAARAL